MKILKKLQNMDKRKKIIFAGITLVLLILVIAVGVISCSLGKKNDKSGGGDTEGSNGTPRNTEKSTELENTVNLDEDEQESIVVTDEKTGEKIGTAGSTEAGKTIVSNGDNTIKLSGKDISYNGAGAEINGSEIIIKAAGEYILTGNLDDGRVIVDVDSNSEVKLIMANANISSSNSCGVYVKSADKVIINLADGTSNTINDGKTYVYDDETEEEPNAAIFSKDDLVVTGTGKLTVNGNFNNGIASKDDLKITGGVIEINAVNNGVKGKDSLVLSDVDLTVNAGGDAFKADNETETEKGYIYVASGTFNITAGEDAMQAATDIEITLGTFDIKTGEGSKVTSSNSGWGFVDSSSENLTSMKGIKATGSININGGTFNIDSEDDCIHANTDITINGGDFKLASGDDGGHADNNLTINDGTINITKSYEGIEATNIYICGGMINVTASDDGINASGGSDSSGMDRPGMGGFSEMSGNIEFTGGTMNINASGDGVDSNGNVLFEAGSVIVYGPIDSGNGTLDYNGTWTQNGGSFIGIGSAGMAQMPGTASSQNSVMVNFTSSYNSGTVVTIKDSSGTTVAEVEGSKTFSNLVLSNSNLKTGEKYTIYVDNEKYEEFTISSVCTTMGTATGGMGGHGGPGGMGKPGENGGERPNNWK